MLSYRIEGYGDIINSVLTDGFSSMSFATSEHFNHGFRGPNKTGKLQIW
jgi:hypothetical protein